MGDVILETLIDTIKLIPFLFISFLLMELFEHKFDNKLHKLISKSGKLGPIIGSAFGIIPQCGFSVIATNFYITRVISLGTLIAIYLSTSDEMLPILLSEGAEFKTILTILLIKFICGIIFGFILDFIFRKRINNCKTDYHICDNEKCDCEHGIVKSSLRHTLQTLLFIFFITFLLNVLFKYVGESLIHKMFFKNNFFGPFIGSLVGLIPNCGASVILTELFLNNAINFGTCISGLLTGSGVAILILLKSNKNIKENIFIISTLYIIGVVVGIFIELMGILM